MRLPIPEKTYWFWQLSGWTLLHLLLIPQSLQAIATGQETPLRVLLLSPIAWLLTLMASHVIYLWNKHANAHALALRTSWFQVLPIILVVSVTTAICYWFILQITAALLPPPETRSPVITAVFSGFLPFILNFSLVNMLLLSLWWFIFRGLLQNTLRTAHTDDMPPALDDNSPVMVSDGKKSLMITPGRIEFASAEGNYVKLEGVDLNMLIRSTLSRLESRLAPARFFRVNRQTLVNLRKIVSIDEAISGNPLLILESGKTIETSRRQGQQLRQLLSL